MSRHALIIGNTEYSDPGLAKLTAPGKDAEAFARVLQDKDICAFDDVRVLLNEPEPVVRDAIDGLFDQKKPDDLLVLYFSGHGVRDEYGSLFLAVKNTNRLRLRATAVKSDFIRESMDQSRSRRQVLILDCCNSGAFAQGTKAATGVSIGTASAFEGTGYGRVVLTASDATQFAWEGEKVIGETQNSLFTHFLVKGLEGEADNDGDGRITIDELYDYAYGQIVNITPKQTPGKWSYKQQGEIVLRQSTPSEDIRPVRLPDDLIDEIHDARPYVREAAVEKLEKILQGKNLGLRRSAIEALESIIADEDTTRRVAERAGQALDGFREAQGRLEPATVQSEEGQKDQRQITTEAAAAKLRAREVTQQLAAQQAEQARKVKRQTEAGRPRLKMPALRSVSWKWAGIAAAILLALALLGYGGTKFVLPMLGLGGGAATPTPEESKVPHQPLVGHTSDVNSVAFSPDGRILASGSSDNTIILWDLSTRRPIGGPLPAHTDTVRSVAFSPDGKTLASGSNDKTVILWNVEIRLPIGAPLTGHSDAVNSVAFSPDGKTLASGSADQTVRLWDVETRQPIDEALKWHTGAVETVAFSPDGKVLASGGADNTIILWDVATREPIGQPLREQGGTILMVAFSPDGKMLASASADDTVALWDVATERPLGEPLRAHSEYVTSVAFSPDGRVLASGCIDNTVILWDVARHQPIGQPLIGNTNSVLGVAFSPDGKTVAAATVDNVVMLWDVSGIIGPAGSPTSSATESPATPQARSEKLN